MTHELKKLIETSIVWQNNGLKSVLATVVDLQGSSYRRPGVRMLLNENNEWIGAVSGGCVEKEVLRQAKAVFETQQSKLITYDGRFRLGCEGVLYILIEPFHISKSLYQSFLKVIHERSLFVCNSYFKIEKCNLKGFGSELYLKNKIYSFSLTPKKEGFKEFSCFSQTFQPVFQLYIFGAEHDAIALCTTAKTVGWDVHIVVAEDEYKSLDNFKNATEVISFNEDTIRNLKIDKHTAITIMSHSLSKDIKYLIDLKDKNPAYLGLLGPTHRRERVFDELLKYFPETNIDFFEKIHAPMGINIGAESAAEISLSIVAEILAVQRKQEPFFLKEKAGKIHV